MSENLRSDRLNSEDLSIESIEELLSNSEDLSIQSDTEEKKERILSSYFDSKISNKKKEEERVIINEFVKQPKNFAKIIKNSFRNL